MKVTGEIHKSTSMFDGRIYGKIDSDEVFNKKLQRLNKIKSKGYPVMAYRNRFNLWMIRHGKQWWDMDSLGKHLPEFDIDKEYV